MYPVFRLAREMLRHRKAPPLPLDGTHVATHICWPWDIDPWMELNNGRALTLYDLGRLAMLQRMGVLPVMKAKGWGGAIAGTSIRYRRRVRMFDRYELRSRIAGWDARFLYAEQSMWRKGECTSHGLLRVAITGPNGIVPPAEVAVAMGLSPESPPLPDWISAWIDAEAQRPWPPMQDHPGVAIAA